jgi:hypothetical protein
MPIRTIRVLLPDRIAGESVLLTTANVWTNVNTFHGIRFSTIAVGSDYDLLVTDFEVLVDASAGGITINLPLSMGNGQEYHIKKIDSTDNVVTVAAQGSDLIDGTISVALVGQWSDCTLIDAAFGYWDNVGSAGTDTSDFPLLDQANVFTALNTFTGLRVNTLAVGSDYDILSTDFELLVDASAGGVTINLPFATGTGQYYHIKKIDATANVVTVAAQTGDLIDGSISVALVDQWSDTWIIDSAFQYWDQPGGDGGGGSIDFTQQILKGDNAGNAVPTDISDNGEGAVLFERDQNAYNTFSLQNLTDDTDAGIAIYLQTGTGTPVRLQLGADSPSYAFESGIFVAPGLWIYASHQLVIASDSGLPILFSNDGGATEIARIDAALTLKPTTAPSSPVEGMIYADSGDHHLYFWNGSAWKQLDN